MRHKVLIKPSEHHFSVETNETILDAALRQGVNLRYGCRNGACGSCMGKLLEGEMAEHLSIVLDTLKHG